MEALEGLSSLPPSPSGARGLPVRHRSRGSTLRHAPHRPAFPRRLPAPPSRAAVPALRSRAAFPRCPPALPSGPLAVVLPAALSHAVRALEEPPMRQSGARAETTAEGSPNGASSRVAPLAEMPQRVARGPTSSCGDAARRVARWPTRSGGEWLGRSIVLLPVLVIDYLNGPGRGPADGGEPSWIRARRPRPSGWRPKLSMALWPSRTPDGGRRVSGACSLPAPSRSPARGRCGGVYRSTGHYWTMMRPVHWP